MRDIAAVAAAALTGSGHEYNTYHPTDPAALSRADMAETLPRVLHHPVAFVDVPPAAMREALLAHHFPK